MKDNLVAVLGGGSGGHAMVAYLAAAGCKVKWWMREADEAASIAAAKTVRSCGQLEGVFDIHMVTDNIGEAVESCPLILVVIPAHFHEDIAQRLAPVLAEGQTVLLNPGRTGGALCFRNVLRKQKPDMEVFIGETQSLMLTCRKMKSGLVDIIKVKNYGQAAFMDPKPGRVITDLLKSVFPQMKFVKSTLQTGLSNIGAVLHPAPVLFNIGRIESISATFLHYYEGITPTIGRFLESMDTERIMVAQSYGIKVETVSDWHRMCYGLAGQTLLETLRLNERYASLMAPENLQHRYIQEEIPTGLVPMVALAEGAGMEVPCIQKTLEMAELIFDNEFTKSGRNATALGIKTGMTVRQIAALFD